MSILRAFCLAIAVVAAGPFVSIAAEPEFEGGLQPWLREHCLSCHNANKANGGVDFSAFKTQASAKGRLDIWKKAFHQVRTGQMPPEDPIDAKAQRPFFGVVRCDRYLEKKPDPGPPLIRPLTRNEYSQTMRDLLRFYHDAASDAGIAEGPRSSKVSRIGPRRSCSNRR
ncbi:MAG: c-type cytochrome domain-containing protein [Gemmataceae bacterium]